MNLVLSLSSFAIVSMASRAWNHRVFERRPQTFFGMGVVRDDHFKKYRKEINNALPNKEKRILRMISLDASGLGMDAVKSFMTDVDGSSYFFPEIIILYNASRDLMDTPDRYFTKKMPIFKVQKFSNILNNSLGTVILLRKDWKIASATDCAPFIRLSPLSDSTISVLVGSVHGHSPQSDFFGFIAGEYEKYRQIYPLCLLFHSPTRAEIAPNGGKSMVDRFDQTSNFSETFRRLNWISPGSCVNDQPTLTWASEQLSNRLLGSYTFAGLHRNAIVNDFGVEYAHRIRQPLVVVPNVNALTPSAAPRPIISEPTEIPIANSASSEDPSMIPVADPAENNPNTDIEGSPTVSPSDM